MKYQIPKKDGMREICSIQNGELYNYQKRLSSFFLVDIPISNDVYGFVKGLSYYDFLVPHINHREVLLRYKSKYLGKTNMNDLINRYYLRIDIKDFFPSISKQMVIDTLSEYFSINIKSDNKECLDLVAEIITLDGSLPQGAVTSPMISNIIFRRYDLRILNYCKKFNVEYSRYADDLLFSSFDKKVHKPFFVKMIGNILNNNFKINSKKVKKSVNEMALNGFVVGNDIRISRSKKYIISKIIFEYYNSGRPKTVKEYLNRLNKVKTIINEDGKVEQVGDIYFSSKNKLINYLAGYRAFLIDWLPYEKNSNCYLKLIRIIKNIEKILDDLENMDNDKNKKM